MDRSPPELGAFHFERRHLQTRPSWNYHQWLALLASLKVPAAHHLREAVSLSLVRLRAFPTADRLRFAFQASVVSASCARRPGICRLSAPPHNDHAAFGGYAQIAAVPRSVTRVLSELLRRCETAPVRMGPIKRPSRARLFVGELVLKPSRPGWLRPPSHPTRCLRPAPLRCAPARRGFRSATAKPDSSNPAIPGSVRSPPRA